MDRIALIGTGGIAHTHARAALACDAQIVAAVNWRAESLRAFADAFGVARTYSTLDGLLADGGCDAAVVCTPNALHAPQTIALLEAGVHVLVEKPMALNAAEAAAMQAAAARSRATLMVAHCRRFDPEITLLRDYVAAGELGAIVRTHGTAVHAHWGPQGWFTQPDLAGGGALADLGVHVIDAVRFLLGDPQPLSVYARLGSHYGAPAVDDTGMLLITWSGGASSYIECGWRQPYAGAGSATIKLYGSDGYGQALPALLLLRRHGQLTELRPQMPARAAETMYAQQMAHFLECCASGARPRCAADDGLAVMRLVDAAYQSAGSGEVVHLA